MILTARRRRNNQKNKTKQYIFKQTVILFCFILLFTSSSPCRKDQFAVLYCSTSLIVLIQVYNWEIQHHSLVCCCELADILNILNYWDARVKFSIFITFTTKLNRIIFLSSSLFCLSYQFLTNNK